MKKQSTRSGKKPLVAVIGGHKCKYGVEETAHNLGKLLSKVGVILVC